VATSITGSARHFGGLAGRPLRRAVVLAVVLAFALPLLAGCSTGFGARTDELYQPGPGLEERTSDIYIINAVIVTDGSGNGTLVAAFINQVRPGDRLLAASATSSTGKKLTVTIVPGSLALRTQASVQVADSGAIRVNGSGSAPLLPGTVASMTFTFARAKPITLRVPVVSNTEQFTSVPVGPVPSSGHSKTSG
jgi:hypothetical protein